MDQDKQRQEVGLIGRMLSMEFLLFVMGSVSLGYGLLQGKMVSVLLGTGIYTVIALLLLLNRRRMQRNSNQGKHT